MDLSHGSRSVPNSTPSSASTGIIKPLKPRLNLTRNPKSKSRNLQPVDILEKFKHLIDGKVVILTPNLVVTRTSPTPEEISPTADSVPALDTKAKKAHAKSGKVNYYYFCPFYFYIHVLMYICDLTGRLATRLHCST